MQFSTWNEAEKFYNIFLPIITIVTLLIVAILVILLFYVKPKNIKYFVIILLVSLIIPGIHISEKHQRYSSYLKEYSLINPLTRDYNVVFSFTSFYSNREKALYYNYNDIDSLRKLSMYQERKVEKNLIYLGKNEYLHYFEYQGNAFKTTKNITFSSIVNGAKLFGSKFELIDPNYSEIGFKTNLNIMFDSILVPERDSNKTYIPINDSKIPSIESVFSNWNF